MRSLPILLVLCLSGCSLLSDPAVRVWTDNPAIAVYVEDYNAGGGPYRVEIEFLEDPARDLAITADHPDVVIARQLASRTVRPFLQDLSRLTAPESLGVERFYERLLALGHDGERRFALPVSFNLPLVLFPAEGPGRSAFALTLDELREATASFNDVVGERYVRMGFSPRWDPAFLTVAARLHGAAFRETASHEVDWNSAGVDRAVDELRSWVAETNGGSETEDRFERRYLYDPFLKLLSTGRIGAVYSRSDYYFSLPEARREDYSFAWLWDGKRIPVLGTILYAAVPEGSSNRRGAVHFLRWLFDPDVQRGLIEGAPLKKIGSFGFAGGFSSLPAVNTDSIALRYLDLLGALPQEDLLDFPRVLPTYWDELAAEVIDPWMNRAIATEAEVAELSDLVDAWLLTRGE